MNYPFVIRLEKASDWTPIMAIQFSCDPDFAKKLAGVIVTGLPDTHVRLFQHDVRVKTVSLVMPALAPSREPGDGTTFVAAAMQPHTETALLRQKLEQLQLKYDNLLSTDKGKLMQERDELANRLRGLED